MIQRHKYEQGAINGMQIALGGLIVLVLALGSFGIWAYVGLNDANSNLNDKIAVAVAQGQKQQADQDQQNYAQQIKEPNTTFKAPDDYCGVSFQFPKDWSVYIANDGTNGGTYQAYLNKGVVPPVSSQQQYALRVVIEQRNYDDVMNQYQSQIQLGKLVQSATNSQGNSGARLDGNFSTNLRGAAVIYKCRSYTIELYTDADTFKPDFNSIVQTLKYNS